MAGREMKLMTLLSFRGHLDLFMAEINLFGNGKLPIKFNSRFVRVNNE
jgi:hypothetical protein